MQLAKELSLSIVLAALALFPVSAVAADNGQFGGYMAMAGSGGNGRGEAEDMTKAEYSEQRDDHVCAAQENKPAQQADSKKQAGSTSKFDLKLQRRLREHPLDADNGETPVRVTAKTTDRGQEMRQFIKDNGGELGSCHGSIITAKIPYRALPALSSLESVVRIEGDLVLLPQK